MYGELTLSNQHQKVNIEIVGGSEDTLYTSVPFIDNQPIILNKKHMYALSFFNHCHLFKFDVQFKTHGKELNRTFYIFEIIQKSVESNKRKEKREITNLPVLLKTESDEYQVCRVLDISKTGAKIECTQPISSKEVVLHFQCKNLTKKIHSTLTWEMKHDQYLYYGVHF